MRLKIIRSDREHKSALKHLARLARSATRKSARLRDDIEILAMLIERYESRVSEVLNHKRSLSLGQIRKLHDGLGIPLRILVRAAARESA